LLPARLSLFEQVAIAVNHPDNPAGLDPATLIGEDRIGGDHI
jgi:hypothetical protein